MIPKKTINGTKINDIDTLIDTYLQEHGFVRTDTLVNHICRNNDISKPTVRRHIKTHIDSGKIVRLGAKEIDQYGIKITDSRAIYLTLKQSMDIKVHLDKRLEELKNGTDVDSRDALAELEYYEKFYIMTPKQLDILVDCLDTQNDKLRDSLIRMIKRYVIDKQIAPHNEDKLHNMLKILLKKIKPTNKANMRTYIIFLLGLFNDPIIIDQLKEDVLVISDSDILKIDYSSIYTAQIIEDSRTELYEYTKELMRLGKENEAQSIKQIRYDAKKLLGMLPDFEIKGVDW